MFWTVYMPLYIYIYIHVCVYTFFSNEYFKDYLSNSFNLYSTIALVLRMEALYRSI